MQKTLSLTLEAVKKHFEHWRLNKKQEKKFWCATKALLEKCDQAHLVLSLSHGSGDFSRNP